MIVHRLKTWVPYFEAVTDGSKSFEVRRDDRGFQRRRAPRAYGAKSRALVAVLVAKARDAARPRPALRPVPGRA